MNVSKSHLSLSLLVSVPLFYYLWYSPLFHIEKYQHLLVYLADNPSMLQKVRDVCAVDLCAERLRPLNYFIELLDSLFIKLFAPIAGVQYRSLSILICMILVPLLLVRLFRGTGIAVLMSGFYITSWMFLSTHLVFFRPGKALIIIILCQILIWLKDGYRLSDSARKDVALAVLCVTGALLDEQFVLLLLAFGGWLALVELRRSDQGTAEFLRAQPLLIAGIVFLAFKPFFHQAFIFAPSQHILDIGIYMQETFWGNEHFVHTFKHNVINVFPVFMFNLLVQIFGNHWVTLLAFAGITIVIWIVGTEDQESHYGGLALPLLITGLFLIFSTIVLHPPIAGMRSVGAAYYHKLAAFCLFLSWAFFVVARLDSLQPNLQKATKALLAFACLTNLSITVANSNWVNEMKNEYHTSSTEQTLSGPASNERELQLRYVANKGNCDYKHLIGALTNQEIRYYSEHPCRWLRTEFSPL